MKQRMIAALILVGCAGAVFAQGSPLAGDVRVPVGEMCPPGTQSTPSYAFEDGRLVRDGTVCQDRRYRN